MAREAELLSRVSHPGIPGLLDRGGELHAAGAEYAWFVMEWVNGTPLYAWAEWHAPSYQEVCRLLAQLARALEALHAIGAVHRDVKGDNVLVTTVGQVRRCSIDFGAGHFQGAQRLTRAVAAAVGLPTTCPRRRACSTCAWCPERDGYYSPTPADDLYALGVTAYRLVMGDYPPPMKVAAEGRGAGTCRAPTRGRCWRATLACSPCCGR